jgi:hypothetical protein
LTDLERLAQLKTHRDAVADAWCQAMEAQDALVHAKVNAYLRDGSHEAEMPTALIRAQELLQEALDDACT